MLLPTDLPVYGIVFYAVFGIFALLLGILDYYELWAMRYSKFQTGKGVPSRLGMSILYGLPLVVSTVFALPYLGSASLPQWIVYAAIMIHFGKRTYEVLFVHNYSGAIQPLTFVVIVVTYSLIAGMITALNSVAVESIDALFVVGIVLFLIGQVGNFYHHKLLADLRKSKTGYQIPHGGWFEKATCPHYFFELLAWLGIFLLSRHLFTLLAFIAMLGYLSARSVKTRQWYQKKFPKYPADRKNMIPYIF
jgi:steroid 5-alpha reductase family enzyme